MSIQLRNGWCASVLALVLLATGCVTRRSAPLTPAARLDPTVFVGLDAEAARDAYVAWIRQVVDPRWHELNRRQFDGNQASPREGSSVEVVFVLRSDGNLSIVKATGDAGQPWIKVAVEAIAGPAREMQGFGPWSQQMIDQFGEEMELTFSFFY